MTEQKPGSHLPGDQDRQETLNLAQEQGTPKIRKERQIKGNSVVLDAWREASRKNAAASETGPDIPLQEFTLEREHNRPLRFTGYRVGWNDVDIERDPRGTQVQIFVTRSNKIVIGVYQWQRKGHLARDRHKAWVVGSPEEALESLIEDGKGKLGRPSREAWDRTCATWTPFKDYDAEDLDEAVDLD